MPTPNAEYVGDRDPVEVLESSLADYRRTIAELSPAAWNTAWAPGKWTVRQIVVHVAQWEQIFGVRLRGGLFIPGYVVQPWDQDRLVREMDAVDGPTAFRAFAGAREMTLALAKSLSVAELRHVFQHAERGPIDARDVLTTIAGHGVHHYGQIRKTHERLGS
jgi:uncharacterized damage-inducible protein DinB